MLSLRICLAIVFILVNCRTIFASPLCAQVLKTSWDVWVEQHLGKPVVNSFFYSSQDTHKQIQWSTDRAYVVSLSTEGVLRIYSAFAKNKISEVEVGYLDFGGLSILKVENDYVVVVRNVDYAEHEALIFRMSGELIGSIENNYGKYIHASMKSKDEYVLETESELHILKLRSVVNEAGDRVERLIRSSIVPKSEKTEPPQIKKLSAPPSKGATLLRLWDKAFNHLQIKRNLKD